MIDTSWHIIIIRLKRPTEHAVRHGLSTQLLQGDNAFLIVDISTRWSKINSAQYACHNPCIRWIRAPMGDGKIGSVRWAHCWNGWYGGLSKGNRAWALNADAIGSTTRRVQVSIGFCWGISNDPAKACHIWSPAFQTITKDPLGLIGSSDAMRWPPGK